MLTDLDRLLFLDFDGVLHPNHCDPDQWFRLLPTLSNCLLEAPIACRIVISSSWRFHHDLRDLISRFPAPIQQRIIGATGDAHIGRHSRFQEIKAYLNRCSDRIDWRALDDSAWEFPDACSELVLCDGAKGLDDRVTGEIGTWLGL